MPTVIKDINANLVERCKSGSEEAYHLLYQKYVRQMFNVSVRILQSTEEAEDILQEAFVTAFGRIETFRGDSTFGAWLKRIVINKSLNQLKKKKLELFSIDGQEDQNWKEDAPEEKNYPILSVNEIQDAVQLLPEGYRVVLTLFLFEGYSHKEIAQELDITESTSKSQYNRAKKKLREILIKSKGGSYEE